MPIVIKYFDHEEKMHTENLAKIWAVIILTDNCYDSNNIIH